MHSVLCATRWCAPFELGGQQLSSLPRLEQFGQLGLLTLLGSLQLHPQALDVRVALVKAGLGQC